MNSARDRLGRRPRRQFFPWGVGNPTFYLTVLAGVAAAGIASIAAAEEAAVAIAAGIASFMVGGILGFIFGIPRYAASSADLQVQNALGSDVVKYRANTNLEQISDWLTKILVGLGLTQFNSIGEFFSSVKDDVGRSLRPSASDGAPVQAAALILLTLISGFLFFYLWSRVYLPRMFQNAEREDREPVVEAPA
jgi:hypothetical protein